MKILITNDDGIHSDGIFHLKKKLENLGEVTVFAPDKERSMVAHSLTMHTPLRIIRTKMKDGSDAYATNGTPSDCVLLALLSLHEKFDLVVSGINRGGNLGDDITYSGTVSAAMEAAIHKIPSFAISITAFKNLKYRYATSAALRLSKKLMKNPLPNGIFLNVNVPNKKPKGIRITRQGKRIYKDRLEKRRDPRGREYFWVSGKPISNLEDGTDIKAASENYISVTPLHLDLTSYEGLKELLRWEL
ncbi:MAG: 5'/3'-nucleotidase SurE [Candidatus Methanofastidiosia archaeon]